MSKQQEEMNNGWEKKWREKYDIGSWVAPNGQRYPYSEIYGFLQSEIDLAVAEERDRKISEMGFYDLVEIVKTLLETNYPLDVFDGSSGDIGPRFIAKLHEALSLITKEN